jgi:2-polyprenyl-3-methyl-5-hydroxy-6-metoxy-1,4-benzoquinol methylase
MLTKRSEEKELLDLGPNFYTQEEYTQCLKILFKINKMLGIFNHTVKLLKQFPPNASLVDIGCGGGLFLLNLSKHYPDMNLLGIDIAEEAITLAQKEQQTWKKTNPDIRVSFQLQQQTELPLAPNSVDIILLTLVCHHLEDAILIAFLKTALKATRQGLIINDLQRHRIAYWSYKLLSPVLFKNRLITHDGLISIQRSFTRQELHTLFQHADIKNYKIRWCFPFRWSITIWKN